MNNYRKLIDTKIAEKDLLEKQINRSEDELLKFTTRYNNSMKARAILQMIAKQTQEGLQDHFSKLVSMALESVFGPNAYEFLVIFEEKRGKTEGKLLFKRGEYTFNPLSCGFGYVDIACFALQISFLIISTNRKILILDEPFKNLRGHLYGPAGQMVQYMAKELGIQFIIITHLDAMIEYSDCIIDITKNGLVSTAEEISYEEFLERKKKRDK